jgi:hypothetical protein
MIGQAQMQILRDISFFIVIQHPILRSFNHFHKVLLFCIGNFNNNYLFIILIVLSFSNDDSLFFYRLTSKKEKLIETLLRYHLDIQKICLGCNQHTFHFLMILEP